MLTDAEIYYYRWEELIEKELNRVIRLLVARYSDEAVAKLLQCSTAVLKKRLNVRPVPDLAGAPVFEVPSQEIVRGRTLEEFEIVIGKGLLEAMPQPALKREMERFFASSARNLGRVMNWVG